MKIIYSDQEIKDVTEHSIFLAGPTPRSKDVPSWRPKALRILRDFNYDGTVFVPEYSGDMSFCDFLHQVEWEKIGLRSCTAIVMWVPRKIPTMPAFTSNVEFGRYVTSGRLLYGRPDDAEKCGYLDWMYRDETGGTPFKDLQTLLHRAIFFRRQVDLIKME